MVAHFFFLSMGILLLPVDQNWLVEFSRSELAC